MCDGNCYGCMFKRRCWAEDTLRNAADVHVAYPARVFVVAPDKVVVVQSVVEDEVLYWDDAGSWMTRAQHSAWVEQV